MRGKKADEVLSLWWLFMIAVIGVGFVSGVLIHESGDIDVREIESEILAEKIVSCIVGQDELKILEDNFNVFETCGIKRELFEGESNFYFRISVYDELDELSRPEINEGKVSYEKDCRVVGDIKARHFPKCSEKSEYFYDEEKRFRLNVFVASNQEGSRSSLVGGNK